LVANRFTRFAGHGITFVKETLKGPKRIVKGARTRNCTAVVAIASTAALFVAGRLDNDIEGALNDDPAVGPVGGGGVSNFSRPFPEGVPGPPAIVGGDGEGVLVKVGRGLVPVRAGTVFSAFEVQLDVRRAIEVDTLARALVTDIPAGPRLTIVTCGSRSLRKVGRALAPAADGIFITLAWGLRAFHVVAWVPKGRRMRRRHGRGAREERARFGAAKAESPEGVRGGGGHGQSCQGAKRKQLHVWVGLRKASTKLCWKE